MRANPVTLEIVEVCVLHVVFHLFRYSILLY